MTTTSTISRRATLGAAAGAVATLVGADAAQSGECPADKRLATHRALDNIPEKLLKRETLTEVHLEKWRGVGNLFLRMRKLTIEPGGFVPTHYHDYRPSIVFVLKGELVEHNSFCADPIVHKEGSWTAEFGPFVGHWWENRTDQVAIVLSADVIPPEYKDMPDMDM
jgi:quercetin dioxygenase-like cupin family protein